LGVRNDVRDLPWGKHLQRLALPLEREDRHGPPSRRPTS